MLGLDSTPKRGGIYDLLVAQYDWHSKPFPSFGIYADKLEVVTEDPNQECCSTNVDTSIYVYSQVLPIV